MTSDPERTLRRTQGDILAVDWRKCWAWCYLSLSSNFAQLSKCHLSRSLPFSISVSPSFAGLAGVQECLSVRQSLTEAARFTTRQVPYLRPGVSGYWFSRGHFIIILVKTHQASTLKHQVVMQDTCRTFTRSRLAAQTLYLYFQKYKKHVTTSLTRTRPFL